MVMDQPCPAQPVDADKRQVRNAKAIACGPPFFWKITKLSVGSDQDIGGKRNVATTPVKRRLGAAPRPWHVGRPSATA